MKSDNKNKNMISENSSMNNGKKGQSSKTILLMTKSTRDFLIYSFPERELQASDWELDVVRRGATN